MCGAIVVPPCFRFNLGMKTLIPWGFVWSMQLLLSTTLLFLPCRPPTPLLLKWQFPFLPITAGAVLGLAMRERPACAQTQDRSVLAKAKGWAAECLLLIKWECQRNGKCRQVKGEGGWEVPSSPCARCAEVDVPLLLRAATGCDSGCSSLSVLPVSLSTRTPSLGTWGCNAQSSSYLCCGAWRGGGFPCLNEVSYLPVESSAEESPPPKLGSLMLLRCDTSIITEQQDKQRGNKLL